MLDLNHNIFTEEHNFKESFESLNGSVPDDIPLSDQLSGIEIRLSDILIIDNKTPRVWPLPGLAKIYFVNIVISDVGSEPICLDLKSFEKVDDGDTLNVDRTLFLCKKTADNKMPSQVHIMTSLVKSKGNLREVGKVMEEIKDDTEFKNLTGLLSVAVNTAKGISNISNVAFSTASIIGKYLGDIDDKPLLTWFQSFTDINGDWDHVGRTEKKAENKYASMKLTTVVRDKGRGN
jgi:hypothetical protein